ncbi:MAG: hypothetical protein EON88_14590 [Brevundimonas sp.]|nr:MAG: hypothetical protein EON88_14590 [Brevundimonas sp.]
MTPLLLLPMGLLALAALAAPLILHIARRQQERLTVFAALRWLDPRPKPRSRLRFDEWPLLVARLVLLALVALWLARPALEGAGGPSAYIAVAPGADLTQARSIAREAPLHWLAPGFPELEAGATVAAPAVGQTASLIRQLDAELPKGATLTIVTPPVIQGVDAERLRLSRKVDWRVVPGVMPTPERPAVPPPILNIRTDAAHASGARYLRAAAEAWVEDSRSVGVGALDSALPPDGQALALLCPGVVPEAVTDWVERGGVALVAYDAVWPAGLQPSVLWRDETGAALATGAAMGRGRLIRLSRSLTPADMPVLLDAAFPTQLRDLLQGPIQAPTGVAATDYRPATGGPSYSQPPLEMRPWLAVLIGLVLLVERYLATRRRRTVAP